jgi:Fic family protein
VFDPNVPYNELPALPPNCDLATTAILQATIRAGRQLAELKGRSAVLPNPAILINTIGLQEAKASSEIENIFTTNDELYRGVDQEPSSVSPQAREVLHYNRALWRGAEQLRQRPMLTTNLFVDLVQTIKGNTAGVRTLPGTRIVNVGSGEVAYTPPEGEAVIRDKLGDLEVFCNSVDDCIDPLIKMALLHYQFEAIHPFYDGNGRTGRVLAILYLVSCGLLDQPILYLSRFLIDKKGEYYARLRAVTAADEWEPWSLYMLRGVEETAGKTHALILAISDLLALTLDEAKSRLPRHMYSKELIEQTFVRPYCRIRHLEEAGLGNRHTCSRYLHQMVEAELLIMKRAGRDNVFINTRLMGVLGGDSA